MYPKRMKKWAAFALVFYLTVSQALAQRIQAISIAVQTEAIAIPFTRLAPVHPGIEIGFSINEKTKPHSIRRWNAYVGWFYHKNLDQSIYLRGEYQFAYTIKETVSVFTPLSIGYMHAFHAKPVYEQKADGSFNEKRQRGRPHAIVNLGLGIRYLKLNTLEPFIKYEAVAQTPFVSTVPVGPRSFFKVGTNFKLN